MVALLRDDGLLIPFAAIAIKATFLCCKKRELLPFVLHSHISRLIRSSVEVI